MPWPPPSTRRTAWARRKKNLELVAEVLAWLDTAAPDSSWGRTRLDCGACRRERLCERRGCDGRPRGKAVWKSRGLATYTCPVLLFTPDVQELYEWFYATHELTDRKST